MTTYQQQAQMWGPQVCHIVTFQWLLTIGDVLPVLLDHSYKRDTFLRFVDPPASPWPIYVLNCQMS
jgi:hypothetical protein